MADPQIFEFYGRSGLRFYEKRFNVLAMPETLFADFGTEWKLVLLDEPIKRRNGRNQSLLHDLFLGEEIFP
ncbi:hypothetical protein ABNQ38_33565 [Azospirillum sp. A29]|uniref:hypothetical protein n=1 Tax=Azospirillum sp. A29 TaxID=3160606 RepID=UPI00366C8F07